MPSDTGTLLEALAPPPVTVNRPLALFLDLDGVLAPMAPTPDAVVADPRRTAVLTRLDAVLDGRMAIVSGRTLKEIDRIADRAALSAAGVHGLERRRRDGAVDRPAASPGLAEVLASFRRFAADRPGVVVEDKGISAGLHFRQSPASADEALSLAHDLAGTTGLHLQPGHMVVELRTPGADKGGAVTAFMAEPPFAGALPVMLGDDLTDEAGFRAAEALGGFGVLVGPYRSTAARYGLAGVPEVLDWLEAVAEAGR
ncbi:trehalose-phosphatase [Brevundimonas staleyi]|uniref:Trehalose 6-phosphate phosphatase n=1 Tax=Brevundimonas staleyi TaxID=74326 RepID=A0ABW0FVX7_9CAUL